MQFAPSSAYVPDVKQMRYLVYYRPSGRSGRPKYSSASSDSPSDEVSWYGLLAPLSAAFIGDIDFVRPYLNTDIDDVGRFMSGRQQLEKARVESLLGDMRTRYELMKDNVHTLEYQICQVDTELMQLPTIGIGLLKDLDRTRTALEGKVMDLEGEKMRERVAAWKDISRLKTDLMESLIEYAETGTAAGLLGKGYGGHDY